MSIVVVINEEIIDDPINKFGFKDPQSFVKQTPRGAYTVASVIGEYTVCNWDAHIERLIKSIAALHTTLDHDMYNAYYKELQKQQLHNTINNTDIDETTHLQNIILPPLILALNKASQLFGAEKDKILIIILTPNNINESSLSRSINVHIAITPNNNSNTHITTQPHTPTPTSTPNVRQAIILGPPRQIPIGKDSAWVKHRHYLEEKKPHSNTEILLCTQDGKLLEGLVTNIYVIKKSSLLSDHQYVLYTAHENEGVVWGTMRKLILSVCDDIGLSVVEEAPRIDEKDEWEEAFLSNSLRGIEALDRIECGKENVWGLSEWTLELPRAGQWTCKINKKLQEMISIHNCDVKALNESLKRK